jgi:hypothetical protein
MIAVEPRGRLGNQMFQFAFGIGASATLGTSFAMRDEGLRGLFTLAPYDREPGRSLRSLRLRAARRVRPYPAVTERELGYEGDPLERVQDRRLYQGYFQSERFFDHVRERVLRAFAFRPEHEQRFRARYGDLLERSYVCCHVRRGDYLTWRGSAALPAAYYFDSLRALDPGEGVPVVFVGDDFEGIREELETIPGSRFEQNDEAVDLLLIRQAASVVVSNSSFAWWGAYLNGIAGDRVAAPRHWLGFKEGEEIPGNIVPERWLQVAAV